jgi:DNA-binding CsgD family transcriptional regulator
MAVIPGGREPFASSVVLVGATDQVQRWARRGASPTGRLRLVEEARYRSELAPRLAPGVIAMIGPESTSRRGDGVDAEAVVLVRRSATRRGVADAVMALETPHALLLGRPERLSLRLAGLTRREQEVLTELALGKVNKEIAKNLHVTRQTAQRYVRRVLKKLRVTNRTEAARVALLGDPELPPDPVESVSG